MGNFIKESFAELEHVVWPTHIETKKFFVSVVSIIIAMTLFTYLLSVIFGNSLFGIRSLIHKPEAVDLSGSPEIHIQPEITTEGGAIQIQPVVEEKK